MTRPAVIRVLREGYLVRKGSEILDASSTVTLVEAQGKRVVVDTGAPKEAPELAKILTEIGVPPERVDFVVNTHLHMDHSGGNDLFPNARFYAHKLESPPVGTMALTGGLRLLPGVELVPTPGHTLGSISVLVRADLRYAICGDAIPTRSNLEQHVPPFINVDPRLALKSMDLLAASSEAIIPGHDALFRFPGFRKRSKTTD